MSDSAYTKRELDLHFADIKECLGRIEAQTIRTNGRVTKLERWQSWLTGAIAVISITSGLVGYIYLTDKSSTKEIMSQLTSDHKTISEKVNTIETDLIKHVSASVKNK